MDSESIELSREVVEALVEVHRHVGPGLVESAYEACVSIELELRGIPFVRQRPLIVDYKGERLDSGVHLDFVVADKLLLELECVDRLLPIHEQRVAACLRLAHLPVAILVNFNVVALHKGVRRLTPDYRHAGWQDLS